MAANSVPEFAPSEIAAAIQTCRRCDLWRHATQAVAGEGRSSATLMLVGEQPGDKEDQVGWPFVGPAGRILDRALSEADIDRDGIYLTNAVKHFKHERRGKRRLHRTPDAGEVAACRWWLDAERRLVALRVIMAMGATAALAVFGEAMPVMKSRRQAFPLGQGIRGVVTIHPSYLLRLLEKQARQEAFLAFAADLRFASRLIANPDGKAALLSTR